MKNLIPFMALLVFAGTFAAPTLACPGKSGSKDECCKEEAKGECDKSKGDCAKSKASGKASSKAAKASKEKETKPAENK